MKWGFDLSGLKRRFLQFRNETFHQILDIFGLRQDKIIAHVHRYKTSIFTRISKRRKNLLPIWFMVSLGAMADTIGAINSKNIHFFIMIPFKSTFLLVIGWLLDFYISYIFYSWHFPVLKVPLAFEKGCGQFQEKPFFAFQTLFLSFWWIYWWRFWCYKLKPNLKLVF